MKSFFIILFVLAFLPLTLACGSGHDEGISTSSPINTNVIQNGKMMNNFYGGNFLMILIQILIIISLILFIIWAIKNLKGGN